METTITLPALQPGNHHLGSLFTYLVVVLYISILSPQPLTLNLSTSTRSCKTAEPKAMLFCFGTQQQRIAYPAPGRSHRWPPDDLCSGNRKSPTRSFGEIASGWRLVMVGYFYLFDCLSFVAPSSGFTKAFTYSPFTCAYGWCRNFAMRFSRYPPPMYTQSPEAHGATIC